MQAAPRRTAHIREMNFEELKEKGLFVAPVEKKYLQLPPPTAQDNLPDITRLISHLQLHHDEHRLDVTLAMIRKIPQVIREDDFRVTATLVRPVRDVGKTRIINIQPGDTSNQSYAIAMDIGTTTIYGQVIDLISGEEVVLRSGPLRKAIAATSALPVGELNQLRFALLGRRNYGCLW